MKRLLIFTLILALSLTMLTACSDVGSKDSSLGGGGEYKVTEEGEGIYPPASELPEYKIGVLLWGYTDILGASVKRNLEYVGKEFNCEMIFAEGGTGGAEAYIAATENLIQSGCDGIVSLLGYAGQIEACDKAGVYFAMMLNEIADEETLAQAAESEYFVGMVTENDYQCGEAMVDDLYEQGCRNIVYISMAPGVANHDNRVRGIEAAIEKYDDLKLLADYRGTEQAEALQSFAANYPEMDGVIVTGGAAGGTETIYQVMQSEGLTDRGVKLATIDIGEGTGERLEAGDLSWIAGGQFPTTGIAFTLVYNALNGDKILEDTTKTLYRNFMVIQSKEEYDQYVKYVEGPIPPYSGDELKALIKKFNPDASEELYNKYAEEYTIEDVVERHKDLIED